MKAICAPKPASGEELWLGLSSALDSSGLAAWAPLSSKSFALRTAFLEPAIKSKYGLAEVSGCVAVALSYGEGPSEPPKWALSYPGPLATIARFARANWYAELVARLKGATAQAKRALAEAELDASALDSCRFLANSNLPEKPLAIQAGLGFAGRNSLVIVRGGSGAEIGSALLLGLLLLPFDPAPFARAPAEAEADAFIPGARCGSCRACVDACPTRALAQDGSFVRERCLQHWSARAGALPPAIEAAWGSRLYGCESCLEACPHFHPDPSARCDRGLLGPGLPASWLVAASDGEMKERLKGTALGMGWMEKAAFRRSAALALKREATI
jgi:epoxyqueuosine reductase QueG